MTTHQPPVNGADRIVCADIQGNLMPNPRLLAICILIVFSTIATLRGAEAAHAADQCPNAAQRAQNNSTQLPNCRAYETVTPAYMEGFSFSFISQSFTDDGNTLSYLSTGTFANNPTGTLLNQYIATRTTTGWTTAAVNPSFDQYEPLIGSGADALSPDLRRSLWKMRARASDADYNYYLRESDGSFTRIGQGTVPGISPGRPFTIGTSADLGHVVFGHGVAIGSVADAALWEFVGTNNTGQPRRVSVTNNGQFIPSQVCFRGMSTDARVIVFSSPECAQSGTLWARVGGTATVKVSDSQCTRAPDNLNGPCNAAAFAFYAGAARDGSRVLFSTTQQLVNADADTTNDLYACDIPDGAPAPIGTANPCAALTRVSGADGARVQHVTAVSDDGTQVYFVAQGVLADNLGTNNAPPASGDSNLYLWTTDPAHPTGQTQFITKLDDPALSNPQMTPDSRYLVFATATKLTTTDNDSGAVDLYRYDTQTQTMVQLSTAISGGGGNGPFDASITQSAKTGELGHPRSASVVSADGSMVVFDTAEALSLADANAGPDVYLWHNGQVSLISGGVGGGSHPWITPSGRDLFFATRQQAPSSSDFYGDIYDARVGGGFDQRAQVPCSGDACQSQQSAPPDLAASVPEGVTGAGPVEVAPVLSLRTVSATQRKRLAVTGKLTLNITTNTPGIIEASATTVLSGKTTTIGSARQTMSTPGTVRMTLTLAKKARARLAARGSLTVRVVVSHPKVALSRSATLRLTKAKRAKATKQASVKHVSGGRS